MATIVDSSNERVLTAYYVAKHGAQLHECNDIHLIFL